MPDVPVVPTALGVAVNAMLDTGEAPPPPPPLLVLSLPPPHALNNAAIAAMIQTERLDGFMAGFSSQSDVLGFVDPLSRAAGIYSTSNLRGANKKAQSRR
jgi:hypothetical protein